VWTSWSLVYIPINILANHISQPIYKKVTLIHSFRRPFVLKFVCSLLVVRLAWSCRPWLRLLVARCSSSPHSLLLQLRPKGEFRVLDSDSKLRRSHSKIRLFFHIFLRRYFCSLIDLSRLIKSYFPTCRNQIVPSEFKFGGFLMLMISIWSLTRAGIPLNVVPCGVCLVSFFGQQVISAHRNRLGRTKLVGAFSVNKLVVSVCMSR
jgi:hypothetical protein